ncbi:helix-turn-helix transcriptional regulator [Fusobacterium sp.]|uniref:helix-turn-helix transcriptional regulator n=1 Tax=Fusobacterium sp. TaxID=68766 RepID=UPI00396C9FD0
MLLTPRQEKIAEIVKQSQPITGDEIAKKLSLTRSALRTDFSILISKGILKSKTRVGYIYQGKNQKKYIKEIMGEVVSVDANMSVYDTILEMFLKDVGTVFITENKSLTGIVSRKDLLKIAIGNTDITKVPISIIMTRMPNIIFCEENEEIIVGVRKIINHQIDSLPVVRVVESKNRKSYKLVGRVTKTNITKLFLEYFDK